MKRTLITGIVMMLLSLGAAAQPRAMGLRGGFTDAALSYQHDIVRDSQFLEIDLGVDGVLFQQPGFRVNANYDFVIAEPCWTSRGTWEFYLGPGLGTGYVYDRVEGVDASGNTLSYKDMGFMLSASIQFGLEFEFWFPLQLSVDLRPEIGFHVSDGATIEGVQQNGKLTWYNAGMFGFIPTVSARYFF